jgi:hypothetical protein
MVSWPPMPRAWFGAANRPAGKRLALVYCRASGNLRQNGAGLRIGIRHAILAAWPTHTFTLMLRTGSFRWMAEASESRSSRQERSLR